MIATVGTSLIGSLKRSQIDWELPAQEIASKLDKLEDPGKISAEISSILSIIDEQLLNEQQNLYLLCSDTKEGKKINEILKAYFISLFHRVHTITIEHLNGEKPEFFKEEGLRNLVKVIVQIIKSVPERESACIINATGGYKAQISFAGLIGQVLKIPVYYQFEGFSSVVQLPVLPVSLDYKLWLKNFSLFQELHNLGILSSKLLPDNVDLEPLKGLIERSGGQLRLSSVGLLLHEVLWDRFKDEGKLYLPTENKGNVSVELIEYLDHIPLSLQTILESIQSLSYVKKVEITGMKDDITGPLVFQILNIHNSAIEGTYGQDQKTWKFSIHTTAKNELELNAVMVELYQRYQPFMSNQDEGSVEFILVRHGQHVGEEEQRIEGWADFELTEMGHKQSELVAEHLKNEHPEIDILYASSLSRAKQTAEHISRELGLQPIILDDLRAMNYGKPGGLTKSEAEILYPLPSKQVIFDRTFDGESNIEFNRRVVELFYELVHRHQCKTVCLVTHGRAINVILKEVMNLPLSHDFRVDSEDTSIHHFIMKNNQIIIRCVNNAHHLDKLSI